MKWTGLALQEEQASPQRLVHLEWAHLTLHFSLQGGQPLAHGALHLRGQKNTALQSTLDLRGFVRLPGGDGELTCARR